MDVQIWNVEDGLKNNVRHGTLWRKGSIWRWTIESRWYFTGSRILENEYSMA